MKCSIIIAVLESHEIVKRQLLYFNKWLPEYPDFELIIVDDGSVPAIKPIPVDFNIKLLRTNDHRRWTQPCARNFGAKHATGEYLLMTDIDHIFTESAIKAVREFDGDKIHFQRMFAVLTCQGDISRNVNELKRHGLKDGEYTKLSKHYNTFGIKRSIFEMMGGYDKKFCGQYGGDDTDFSDRYGKLHYAGKVKRSKEKAAVIFAYPNPRNDCLKLFHDTRRNDKIRNKK